MSSQSYIDAFRELGLSEVQSLAYGALVREGASTGYAVAKSIGKPVANTYKALAELEDLDFVVAAEGDPRLFRATSPKLVVESLSRSFEETIESLLRSLPMPESSPDEHVYRLQSVDATFDRARDLLSNARTLVLADAFPKALQRLQPHLERAAKRVDVRIKAYAPVEAFNHAFVSPGALRTRERWPGEWLTLVVDGSTFLVALFDRELEQLHQAVVSQSAHMSWLLHGAVSAEIRMAALETYAAANRNAALAEALAATEYIKKLPTREGVGMKRGIAGFKK